MRVLDEWLLTPERVAVHLPTGTAVVADLHLGYEAARQRRGEAVPAVPLAERLAPLAALFFRADVQSLAIAGDLFEEGRACSETFAELQAWLKEAAIELAGIAPGNHDRGMASWNGLGPICAEGISLGRWHIVHGDEPTTSDWLVYGHHHPCVRRSGLTMPCFLVGERQLVLPAFTTDAAGANVLRAPRWAAFRCCAIAGDVVLDLGPVAALRSCPTKTARRRTR